MEFKLKPRKRFKLKNIILSVIFIFAYGISIFTTLQKPNLNIDNKINDLLSSKNDTQTSKTDTENSKNNDKRSPAKNDSSTKSTQSSSNNVIDPKDYSRLTVNEYVNLCVDQTFGKKNNIDKPFLSSIRFTNNCQLIHINIGYYVNSEQLKAAAINASVELYKSLYTLYPEKFGHTVFGITVSGRTINKKGTDTDIEEAAVSWYDDKTLKALDINKLTVDNFKNTVYRFYDYQNMAGIQRD
jgi:hypothetical protein